MSYCYCFLMLDILIDILSDEKADGGFSIDKIAKTNIK